MDIPDRGAGIAKDRHGFLLQFIGQRSRRERLGKIKPDCQIAAVPQRDCPACLQVGQALITSDGDPVGKGRKLKVGGDAVGEQPVITCVCLLYTSPSPRD